MNSLFFERVFQLDEINDEDCFAGMVLSVSEMAELMLWMYPEYLSAGYVLMCHAIKQIRHGRAYGPGPVYDATYWIGVLSK